MQPQGGTGGGTARTGHTLSKGTDLPGRCHPVRTPPPRLRALDQDRPPLNLQAPASLSGSKLLLSATKEHVAVSSGPGALHAFLGEQESEWRAGGGWVRAQGRSRAL